MNWTGKMLIQTRFPSSYFEADSGSIRRKRSFADTKIGEVQTAILSAQ